MKRIILITLLAFQALGLLAAEPQLNLLKAFDGRYNNSKGVSISMIEQPGNYFMSITSENNPAVTDQLMKWADEARVGAASVTSNISDGEFSIIILRKPDINIGQTFPADKSEVHIWIQSGNPLK